jgi:hypothetical protein
VKFMRGAELVGRGGFGRGAGSVGWRGAGRWVGPVTGRRRGWRGLAESVGVSGLPWALAAPVLALVPGTVPGLR